VPEVSHSEPVLNLVAWANWYPGFVCPNFYLLQEFFL